MLYTDTPLLVVAFTKVFKRLTIKGTFCIVSLQENKAKFNSPHCRTT
jgi:hypothetical protein